MNQQLIQAMEKQSKSKIEQQSVDSTKEIVKIDANSLNLIINQRETTIKAISDIRKKHFGEGISFEPFVIQSNEIKVMINGKLQSYTQPPEIVDGYTLVPLRGIFEELDATVLWNSKDKSIDVTKDQIKLFLQVDNVNAKINDRMLKLDVAPSVLNGSTMVPLRFVSESLGANVRWDGTTRTIWITTEE